MDTQETRDVIADRMNNATEESSAGLGVEGRIIRPQSGGVSLDGSPLRLQDIGALAQALQEESEGKLQELRNTIELVEDRLRAKAEDSRNKIEKALSVTREQIESQLLQAKEQNAIDRKVQLEEGFQQGQKDGFSKGYEEGLEAGMKEGRLQGESAVRESLAVELQEQTNLVQSSIQNICRGLEGEYRQLFQDARTDLLSLAMGAASSITRATISESPELLLNNLEAAITRLQEHHCVVVRVNPDDFQLTEEHLPTLSHILRDCEELKVETDSSVDRGGCIVTSGSAVIDLSISTQLEVIHKQLIDAGGRH